LSGSDLAAAAARSYNLWMNEPPNGAAAPWDREDAASRSLLRLIAQSTNDGIWDWDLETDAVYYSPRWLELIGYVPEEPNLYGYLTGLEYLQLAGGLRGLPEDRVLKKANELLDLLSLSDARWVPISAYSKGMKQRVLIAAALLHDPDVLIFDEAQSGLDIANSLLFRHLMRSLAARGKVILYISHVLELVEKVCEHIIVLYRGRVVADDSVSRLRDLMHLPNLEEIFTQLVEQHDMESRAQEIAAAIAW